MAQATSVRNGVAAARRPASCGAQVSDETWSVLTEIVDSCGLSRSELAGTICEAVGWVRPNGRPKVRECYEYLEDVAALGLLKLPERRVLRGRGPTSIHYTEAGREQPSREAELADVKPVRLGLVANAEERALWRELVERYHCLGHKVAYGAHLRYLVFISAPGPELAGCLQSSSAGDLRRCCG